MVRGNELEIIVGEPPKRTVPPIDVICHIEEKKSELSPLQEFLFDWLDYVPSKLKAHLKKRANKLGMGAVYVVKYYAQDQTMLKCYFSDKRLPDSVYIPPYNFFQKNDTF